MSKMIAAACFAATALAATAAPASAQGVQTQFLISEIQARTPSCAAYPEFGVVGRVSGIVGGYPTRGVSFEGCFPDFASCEAWKGPVSGKITGRLTLSQCSYR